MAATSSALLVLALAVLAAAQRGSYSGRKPVGYPMITTSTPAPGSLGDRFGADGSIISTTTIRLPAEALGDRELFDRLSKLPVDQQPFWLINWQALEANRNNPQSYQPNRNSFVGAQSSGSFSSPNTQTNRFSDQNFQNTQENRFSNQNFQNAETNRFTDQNFQNAQTNRFTDQNFQNAQTNRFTDQNFQNTQENRFNNQQTGFSGSQIAQGAEANRLNAQRNFRAQFQGFKRR